MISDMVSGFVKVISITGMIIAILLVLAILGAVNQHDKLTSFAAVGSGFGDVLHWIGELFSEAAKHI